MKKILLSCLAFLAIILFLFSLPLFFPAREALQNTNNVGLPWQIERDEAGQTRVFGLSPGVSVLNDAIAQFGEDIEIAIMIAGNVPKGEEAKDAALEGYYNQVVLDFIHARLILTLEASPDMVESMLSRSVKGEYMRNGSRKFSLHPDDIRLAATLPLAAMTLIPGGSLDDETITSRFGAPAGIIPVGETLHHYLYPDKGLDIILDRKGKDVLQYVSPADFEVRIMRPLRSETQNRTQNQPQN
ncbi:MAG: hypothetical protein LBI31_07155 [Zoogloeaceae bacterium]|jgi:hypothetical protein|nr:hypothetical protein [Zoogloeaceae bacterium]